MIYLFIIMLSIHLFIIIILSFPNSLFIYLFIYFIHSFNLRIWCFYRGIESHTSSEEDGVLLEFEKNSML